MKTDIISQMNAEKPDDVLSDLERKRTCCLCNWTNVSLINLGEPGKPRWACHGCCKRTLESRDQLRAELEKLKAENSTFLFELSIWSKADAVLDADPSSTDDPCYINIQRIISQRDQWRAVAEQAVEAMKSMRPLEMGKAVTAYEKLKGQP